MHKFYKFDRIKIINSIIISPENFDLNKLREVALSGENKPDKSENEGKPYLTYEDYKNMPPEQLAQVADENDTTPEKFLKSKKFLENIRATVKNDSGTINESGEYKRARVNESKEIIRSEVKLRPLAAEKEASLKLYEEEARKLTEQQDAEPEPVSLTEAEELAAVRRRLAVRNKLLNKNLEDTEKE